MDNGWWLWKWTPTYVYGLVVYLLDQGDFVNPLWVVHWAACKYHTQNTHNFKYMGLLYLKLILSNQIAPLAGHNSLYGPLNSWAGHIGIYGLLMGNKTNFGWKLVENFVQNYFCLKKLLLELDLWPIKQILVETKYSFKKIFVKKNCCSKKTFCIINRLPHSCSGHTGIYSSLRSG